MEQLSRIGGDVKAPAWLSVDWILSQFGRNRKNATLAFRKYVEEGVDGSFPADSLRGGLILGGDEFLERIQDMIESKQIEAETPRRRRFAAKSSLQEIFQGSMEKGKERDERISRAIQRHEKNG